MSDPVPPRGGHYPPPMGSQSSGQPAPGHPAVAGPQSPPGQELPGQPRQVPPLTHVQTLSTARKFGIAGALGAAITAMVIIGVFFGDKAEEAKIGDCVTLHGKVPTEAANKIDAEAEVVDCSSSEAAYTVVGRVNNETGTDTKSCDKYFTDEAADYAIYSGSNHYVLCLKVTA